MNNLESEKPHLTKARWRCLMAFKRQPELMHRQFAAKELIIERSWHKRERKVRSASGVSMDSLRNAGWVERASEENKDQTYSAFRVRVVSRSLWSMTDAGRAAVEQCPDIFPGKPIYGAEKHT